MTRRTLLGALPAGATRGVSHRPPNVILFMTDDHGAWATRAYGCAGMSTPNIDALARTGTTFTSAYAATPVCSPSRMTWLTGKLPYAHGVQDWLMPEDSFGPKSRRWLRAHLTWSELLAKNGYTLGLSGKWHMGEDDRAQAGFTYWATVPGGGGPYRNVDFIVNGEKRHVDGFKTDAVGDFAIDFLNAQKKDRPFCLLVPFYAPHTPYNYQPDTYREPYDNSNFSCFPDEPVHPRQNSGLRKLHGSRDAKHAYSALISGADANIGRVLHRLDELGLRDKTCVIFTADQGWNAGHHGVWGKGNGTVPFNMYEESIRIPLIWSQPGHIPQGRKVDALVSSYDFFHTILDYTDTPHPSEDRTRLGRSYMRWLNGSAPSWRDRLYFEYAYVRSLRTREWKYVERTGGWPSELYDLRHDAAERTNLIETSSERIVLAADLERFFRLHGAPPLADWRSTTRQILPGEHKIQPVA